MTQQEIKSKVEDCYRTIETAQEMLESLRAQCLHLDTYNTTYTGSNGKTQPAKLCCNCEAFIRYLK